MKTFEKFYSSCVWMCVCVCASSIRCVSEVPFSWHETRKCVWRGWLNFPVPENVDISRTQGPDLRFRTLGPDLAYAKITFPGRGSPTSNPRLGNRGLHKEPGFVKRCLRVYYFMTFYRNVSIIGIATESINSSSVFRVDFRKRVYSWIGRVVTVDERVRICQEGVICSRQNHT